MTCTQTHRQQTDIIDSTQTSWTSRHHKQNTDIIHGHREASPICAAAPQRPGAIVEVGPRLSAQALLAMAALAVTMISALEIGSHGNGNGSGNSNSNGHNHGIDSLPSCIPACLLTYLPARHFAPRTYEKSGHRMSQNMLAALHMPAYRPFTDTNL